MVQTGVQAIWPGVGPGVSLGFPLVEFEEADTPNPGYEDGSEIIERIQATIAKNNTTDVPLYLAHGYTPPPCAFEAIDACITATLTWLGDCSQDDSDDEADEDKLDIPNNMEQAQEWGRWPRKRRRIQPSNLATKNTRQPLQTVTDALKSQKGRPASKGPLNSTQHTTAALQRLSSPALDPIPNTRTTPPHESLSQPQPQLPALATVRQLPGSEPKRRLATAPARNFIRKSTNWKPSPPALTPIRPLSSSSSSSSATNSEDELERTSRQRRLQASFSNSQDHALDMEEMLVSVSQSQPQQSTSPPKAYSQLLQSDAMEQAAEEYHDLDTAGAFLSSAA